MNDISSKTLSGFKYVYLIIFFTLLSGVFYPITVNTNYDRVFLGIFILFLSLAGSILLYKATTSETKRGIFFGSGFVLIGFSLYSIFWITEKV
jgi:hypothetical protein